MLTDGKKKRCIAKIFIIQKIFSRWAWKLISIASLIQTFIYQTVTRLRASRATFLFFMRTAVHVLCCGSTTCNQMNWCKTSKRPFMQPMMRKPFYFWKKCVSMTSHHPEDQLLRENATRKRIMNHAGAFWFFGEYLRQSVQNGSYEFHFH